MTRPSARISLCVIALTCGLGSIAFSCGPSADGSTEPACLAQAGTLNCSPLYGVAANGDIAPTFDELWSRTLKPVCAQPGCHVAPNPQNGLALNDENTAYADLLGKSSTGEPRVTPKDLRCGKFIVRLETAGEPWSMPPGNHLDEPVLCVIRHWIANGAQR